MSFIPDVKNVISTDNSTSALLTSSATFTGSWEDVTLYTSAAVAILGSNATDGTLYMDLSQDGGTTFTSVPVSVADTTFDLPHILNIVESHFRVRYVNGTTAMTGTFTLQTKYSIGQQLGLLHVMGDTIKAATEGQVVKAVITGVNPDSTYGNVRLGDANEIQVANYGMEVSRGNLTGKTNVRVEARNTSVGTTERIVWNGGIAFNFLTSASTVRVKAGGNANDTAAGSGAREITVDGLDTNGDEISETIATAGASASSATSASFRRVNCFRVSQAGTYATGAIGTGSNTGDLSIETSGGTLLGTMLANLGTSSIAIYTIPNGKKGYFKRIRVTPEGSKAVTFRLWTRKNFDDTSAPLAPKILRSEWKLISESAGFDLDFPFELDGKEEVFVTAKTGSGNSEASVAFEIELIDD